MRSQDLGFAKRVMSKAPRVLSTPQKVGLVALFILAVIAAAVILYKGQGCVNYVAAAGLVGTVGTGALLFVVIKSIRQKKDLQAKDLRERMAESYVAYDSSSKQSEHPEETK